MTSTAHAARRGRLRADLAAAGVPGLLVTHLANVRYLSGFSGSNGVLFVSADDPDDDVIATDGRYATQVAEECPDLPVLLDRASLSAMARALAGHGIVEMEVEEHLTLAEQRTLAEHLRHLPLGPQRVEDLRVVKDADELAALAQACDISVRAFEQLMTEVRAGWTEIAVARRLEQLFGELGAEDRAFDTIVAAGPASARPHGAPTTRPLQSGDLVIIDFGARVGGYHADMTRTAVVGQAAPWQLELHAAVHEAQRAARDAAHAGVGIVELDAAARDVLAGHGLAEAFVHGLGHGVGLAIHEAPMVNPRSVGSIAASTPITVEPGAYLPGRGGVRIEDTLVVEPTGPRVLTEADRGLWPIGA